jgi:sortase A
MGGVWSWLRGLLGAVLVAAAAGSGLVVFGPQPMELRAAAAPAAVAHLANPSTLAPPLPQPSPSPSDPHADVPLIAIGEIAIPDMGLRTTLYEGIWETVIDVGPGHWPGTAEPGQWGNTVIAAHRVSHGGPFRRIAELQLGDEIVLTTPAGTFTYEVTGTDVVTPDAVWIADQHPGRTITLFACHPLGSATHRYVVTGVLVD